MKSKTLIHTLAKKYTAVLVSLCMVTSLVPSAAIACQTSGKQQAQATCAPVATNCNTPKQTCTPTKPATTPTCTPTTPTCPSTPTKPDTPSTPSCPSKPDTPTTPECKPIYYTITFKNDDGTVLQTLQVKKGDLPQYTGATPTKSDDKYTYTFTGWMPQIVKAYGNAVYVATYKKSCKPQPTPTPTPTPTPEPEPEPEPEPTPTPTPTPTPCTKKYTIKWVNYDGSILEIDKNVPQGTTPTYDGATPTRPEDDKYTYEFDGWTPEISPVTGNKIYKAKYKKCPKPVTKEYTVKWVNYDGSLLEIDPKVPEGVTPTYDGATPTRPEDDDYTYVFIGWDPEVSPATGNVTYIAQYKKCPKDKKYTVTWVNYDGTELEKDTEVPAGTDPSYDGATPTRPDFLIFTYVFTGWSPELSPVTGDITYTAQYDTVIKFLKYTVTWVNYDGTELEKDTGVVAGTMPSYDGETPVRPDDDEYTYVFIGWDPAISPVTGNVTYTAQYKQLPKDKKYTVSWVDEDGTPLETDTDVPAGTMPSYDGATPTKDPTDQYTYEFDGWTPEIAPVTGDITYTATYKETLRNYTVTWVNDDGEQLEQDTEVPYGTMPSYDSETPTKEPTAQYTYEFDGWTPEVSPVTGDVTYTATYKETLRDYTIKWVDEDGTPLETDENVPYGETPTFDGTTPTKDPTDQYTYEFDGWTPEVSPVTGDTTYTATYKEKVRQYTITYDLNGGTLDGKTGTFDETHSYGEVITIAPLPSREGHTFLYWKGSEYQPGDKYTVVGDHTFVAQWKKNSSDDKGNTNNNTKKASSKVLPKTGDVSYAPIIAVIALAGVALIAFGAYKRRRNNA